MDAATPAEHLTVLRFGTVNDVAAALIAVKFKVEMELVGTCRKWGIVDD